MKTDKLYNIMNIATLEGSESLVPAVKEVPDMTREISLAPKMKFLDGAMVPDANFDSKEGLDRYMEALTEATGTKDYELSINFIMKALDGCLVQRDNQNIRPINNVIATMAELNPQDVTEGMLVTQMIAVFHQSMKHMEGATQANSMDLVERHTNMATKLQRTFTAQMEALNRHRRKGMQKVIVQHVQVNNGGQAIVGSIEGGGSKISGKN